MILALKSTKRKRYQLSVNNPPSTLAKKSKSKRQSHVVSLKLGGYETLIDASRPAKKQ